MKSVLGFGGEFKCCLDCNSKGSTPSLQDAGFERGIQAAEELDSQRKLPENGLASEEPREELH